METKDKGYNRCNNPSNHQTNGDTDRKANGNVKQYKTHKKYQDEKKSNENPRSVNSAHKDNNTSLRGGTSGKNFFDQRYSQNSGTGRERERFKNLEYGNSFSDIMDSSMSSTEEPNELDVQFTNRISLNVKESNAYKLASRLLEIEKGINDGRTLDSYAYNAEEKTDHSAYLDTSHIDEVNQLLGKNYDRGEIFRYKIRIDEIDSNNNTLRILTRINGDTEEFVLIDSHHYFYGDEEKVRSRYRKNYNGSDLSGIKSKVADLREED